MQISERERVEVEDQLSEAEKNGDRQCSGISGEKVFESQEAVRVRDTGVQGAHIHGEQEAVRAMGGERKVLEKTKCVVGVFDVRRQGSYYGLEDEVQKLRDLFCGTRTSRNNGTARCVGFVYLG